MPDFNSKVSYFAKNEASYSINKNSFGNYTMLGGKCASNIGNFELGLAFKESSSSWGGFIEGKYTSPKIANSDWAIESRTRLIAETPYNEKVSTTFLTQRLAAKGSWNLGKGWSLYNITGVNAKVSEQKGLQSLTPTTIAGVGYNVSRKFNVYAEGELSKSYDLKKDVWEDLSPSVYLGLKYSF